VDVGGRRSSVAERARLRRAELEAILRARLETGESVLAHDGPVMVTDRRVLFAWEGVSGGGGSRWHSDAVGFEEVTRWSVGRRHDERPLVRLEHPIHLRTERVAAHRLLWLSWGNAEAEVPRDDVTLAFGGQRDEEFRAVVERLERTNVPRGEEFAVVLPGTREERTRGSHATLYREDPRVFASTGWRRRPRRPRPTR
jgi:hypothetical protein